MGSAVECLVASFAFHGVSWNNFDIVSCLDYYYRSDLSNYAEKSHYLSDYGSGPVSLRDELGIYFLSKINSVQAIQLALEDRPANFACKNRADFSPSDPQGIFY